MSTGAMMSTQLCFEFVLLVIGYYLLFMICYLSFFSDYHSLGALHLKLPQPAGGVPQMLRIIQVLLFLSVHP
jgi:hypothetical protein